MEERKKLKIPPILLVMDFIGVILLGLGLAEWLAETNLVPEAFQFENYYIVMVVAGGLLMLPLLMHVVRFATGSGPREI